MSRIVGAIFLLTPITMSGGLRERTRLLQATVLEEGERSSLSGRAAMSRLARWYDCRRGSRPDATMPGLGVRFARIALSALTAAVALLLPLHRQWREPDERAALYGRSDQQLLLARSHELPLQRVLHRHRHDHGAGRPAVHNCRHGQHVLVDELELHRQRVCRGGINVGYTTVSGGTAGLETGQVTLTATHSSQTSVADVGSVTVNVTVPPPIVTGVTVAPGAATMPTQPGASRPPSTWRVRAVGRVSSRRRAPRRAR